MVGFQCVVRFRAISDTYDTPQHAGANYGVKTYHQGSYHVVAAHGMPLFNNQTRLALPCVTHVTCQMARPRKPRRLIGGTLVSVSRIRFELGSDFRLTKHTSWRQVVLAVKTRPQNVLACRDTSRKRSWHVNPGHSTPGGASLLM